MFGTLVIFDLRIQMPYLCEGFVAQQPAIIPDVVGQPLGAVAVSNIFARMDRFVAAEPGGEFNERFVDDDGEWVQIGPMRMRAKALSF